MYTQNGKKKKKSFNPLLEVITWEYENSPYNHLHIKRDVKHDTPLDKTIPVPLKNRKQNLGKKFLPPTKLSLGINVAPWTGCFFLQRCPANIPFSRACTFHKDFWRGGKTLCVCALAFGANKKSKCLHSYVLKRPTMFLTLKSQRNKSP